MGDRYATTLVFAQLEVVLGQLALRPKAEAWSDEAGDLYLGAEAFAAHLGRYLADVKNETARRFALGARTIAATMDQARRDRLAPATAVAMIPTGTLRRMRELRDRLYRPQ